MHVFKRSRTKSLFELRSPSLASDNLFYIAGWDNVTNGYDPDSVVAARADGYRVAKAELWLPYVQDGKSRRLMTEDAVAKSQTRLFEPSNVDAQVCMHEHKCACHCCQVQSPICSTKTATHLWQVGKVAMRRFLAAMQTTNGVEALMVITNCFAERHNPSRLHTHI